MEDEKIVLTITVTFNDEVLVFDGIEAAMIVFARNDEVTPYTFNFEHSTRDDILSMGAAASNASFEYVRDFLT